MDTLFTDLPEDLSPRLKWMARHSIRVEQSKDKSWIAYKERTKHFCRDNEEGNAVIGLAKKLKLKLWNQ